MLAMRLQQDQVLTLTDNRGQQIGQVSICRTEDDLLFGTFTPGPGFPSVQAVFHAFEEAVNLQALSLVDERADAIAALGLSLRPAGASHDLPVHDAQLWSDGNFTCRVSASGPSFNGASAGEALGRPVVR